MTLDFSRCRLPPFIHQREDVAWLIERSYAFIASEMRTGKSKIVIDAAQFLYEQGTINKVIIIAPAPVRDVWADKTLGELAKHLWLDLPATITEFHARIRTWAHGPHAERTLNWYVTNFEFIRSKQRVAQLLAACGQKTMLVLDESSFVKNHAAQQTKACLQLRRACGRVVLLNGTPIFHSPLDLFSQGNILHESIIGTKYITHFKARYAIQSPVLGWGGRPLDNGHGRPVQKIDGWTNLDDLQRRFAPYTVRRLQTKCLDLPPKLDPVTLTATLTLETWRTYKNMRDQLVVWLKSGDVATSATAAVKALRLSQITSGFLGGIEDAGIEEQLDFEAILKSINLGENRYGTINQYSIVCDDTRTFSNHSSTPRDQQYTWQEVGREKLDVLLWFISQRLEADPNLHLVSWCRFRAELFRMVDAVREKFPQFEVGAIHGGQKKAERLRALALLKPETSPQGPVFVGGTFGTGAFGIDMCAAHTSITMSSDYSPGKFAQSAERVVGPNQKFPIAYFDIIAVGPKNQKTIDHAIVAARRAGEDIASWTSAAWVKALTEDIS